MNLKKIFTNTFAQVLIRFTTSMTTFVIAVLVSYFLGLDLFGSYTKIITFVTFFYLFIDFSLNTAYLKLHQGNEHEHLYRLLAVRLVIALSLFIGISLVTFPLPYDSRTDIGFSYLEKTGIILLSLTFFIQAFILSASALLQKHLAYTKLLLPTLTSSVVLLVCAAGAIFFKNFYLLLASYILSGSIYCVLVGKQLKKDFLQRNMSVKDIKPFAKKLLVASFPLGIMIIMNLLYFKSDIFVLSLYRSTFDVGVYGLSYRLFEFLLVIPAFFSSSVYPLLLEKQHTQEFTKLFRTYLRTLIFISLPTTVIAFFGIEILSFIKQDFSFAITPFRILLISLPVFFVTSLLQWVLIIKEKTFHLIMLYATTLVLNITLNFWYIPRYGYNAAAVSTVIAEIIVCVGMIMVLYHSRKKV